MKKLDTSWFDIDKYKPLSDLDLMSWYRVLMSRWILLHSLDKGKESNYPALASLIKNDPLYTDRPESPSFLQEPYTPDFVLADSDHPILSALSEKDVNDLLDETRLHAFNSVRSLGSIEIMQIYQIKELANIWEDCSSILRNEGTNKQAISAITPIDLRLNATDYKSASAHVVVDTSSTDEQILSDFKAWLARYRLESGVNVPKKKFTLDKAKEWFAKGVVPYLDLTIIAKIEQRSITQAKLGQLISPKGYDACLTERVRKTIKPLATSLMTKEMMFAFREQFDEEYIMGKQNGTESE